MQGPALHDHTRNDPPPASASPPTGFTRQISHFQTCWPRTVGVVRLIVDAMNVIGTRPDGWWKDRRRAMIRLVDDLERWASTEGHPVTVVFEGPSSPPIRSTVIGVSHPPKASANSADDEIVRLIRADDRPEQITVVTSDTTLADRVTAAGAATRPAASFRDLIDPLR